MKTDDPRLTAYALGELDPPEQAEIEALLQSDPEAAFEVEEIRALAGLVRTQLAAEPAPSLAPVQQRIILAIANKEAAAPAVDDEKVVPISKGRRVWVPVAIAACVAVVAGLALPYLRTADEKAGRSPQDGTAWLFEKEAEKAEMAKVPTPATPSPLAVAPHERVALEAPSPLSFQPAAKTERADSPTDPMGRGKSASDHDAAIAKGLAAANGNLEGRTAGSSGGALSFELRPTATAAPALPESAPEPSPAPSPMSRTAPAMRGLAKPQAPMPAGDIAVKRGREIISKDKVVKEAVEEKAITGDIGVNVVAQSVSRGLIFENQRGVEEPYADPNFRMLPPAIALANGPQPTSTFGGATTAAPSAGAFTAQSATSDRTALGVASGSGNSGAGTLALNGSSANNLRDFKVGDDRAKNDQPRPDAARRAENGGGVDLSTSSAVAGTGGLTKAGTGNFVLSGANTYTGGTAVNAGTLAVNGESAAGQLNTFGKPRTKNAVARVPDFDTGLAGTPDGGHSKVYPADTLIPGRAGVKVAEEEKRTGSFNFGAGFTDVNQLPKLAQAAVAAAKPAATPSASHDALNPVAPSAPMPIPAPAAEAPATPKPAPVPDDPTTRNPGNTDAYDSVTDNAFLPVLSNPLSTFSIDVDTASYSNVRRMLTSGQRPPKGAVRIEELVNYFKYDYPQPKNADPFSVNMEVAACPWTPEHRLLRIGLKARELDPETRPQANLVFLLDVSGSMSPQNRLPLVIESLKLLVDQLGPQDTVAIAVYAGASGTVLEPTNDKDAIRAALGKLHAGGSTNGASGIRLAYELAKKRFNKTKTNRVILATDGDFNVGTTNQSELVDLITAKAKSGVFLTVLGVGYGNLKDSTLEKLADKGNGNYGYIDSLAEGRKVLVEQMSGTLFTVAKDVKMQIEFNPAQVAGYRLIGYENRLLAKEDFNDDTKDAGEIGAGHTVTALYELVPAGGAIPGEQKSTSVDVLKYQFPAVTNAMPAAEKVKALDGVLANDDKSPATEMLTTKLRWKAPDGDVSTKREYPLTDAGLSWEKSSPDFRWAAAVASFGMILRDSPYKGQATWSSTRELAVEGQGEKADGHRIEFMELLEKAEAVTK